MTPGKAEPPATRMVTTKFLLLRRIVTRSGAIPKSSNRRRGEQLQLPVSHETDSSVRRTALAKEGSCQSQKSPAAHRDN
jgi:hypothetical protein